MPETIYVVMEAYDYDGAHRAVAGYRDQTEAEARCEHERVLDQQARGTGLETVLNSYWVMHVDVVR